MASELKVVGQRLATLRSIYGLTQGELADQLGVTQSFLSHITRGARPMPDALVLDACRKFAIPPAFFAVKPVPSDLGAATFRKNSRASAKDEGRVVALFDEASRLFREISKASGYHPATLPDPEDYDNDVERVAEAVRSALKLSTDEPVKNVTRAIERLGIGVVDNLDHLSEQSRGHTAVSRPSHYNDRPLVALISQVPGSVKRLTLMHEVGHLVFDQDLAGPITSTRSPEERRAYQFAGAMLIPAAVVEARISESLNLHGYLPVKADYGISVGALIIRARELGVIGPDRARSLQIQLSSQGWRKGGEPVPVSDEKPLLFGQALHQAYGKRATAKAAHALGTSPDWLHQWTHQHSEVPPPQAGQSRVIDFQTRAAMTD